MPNAPRGRRRGGGVDRLGIGSQPHSSAGRATMFDDLSTPPDLLAAKQQMLEKDYARAGNRDTWTLHAMARVPRTIRPRRGQSVCRQCPADRPRADDQPAYIVALMTEMLCLTGAERVLEIGTGSGYQTAVLAGNHPRSLSVERIEALSPGRRGPRRTGPCKHHADRRRRHAGLPASRALRPDSRHGRRSEIPRG